MDELPDAIREDQSIVEIPVEPAAEAPPAPVPVTGSIELEQREGERFDDGYGRNEAERKRESFALRTQYDAFIEHHNAPTVWSGVAAVGTIVAIEADHAVMHVGRHQFVKFDIAKDLHGAIPEVGVSISVERDGSIAERSSERDLTLERGRAR